MRFTTIQKFSAFLLLLVFATGSAPKALFHDLIAGHEDVAGCTVDHGRDVLHQHETDCDFDDLVVPAPFIYGKSISIHPAAPFIIQPLPVLTPQYIASFLKNTESRGPPTI